jgi:cell division protein FtsB
LYASEKPARKRALMKSPAPLAPRPVRRRLTAEEIRRRRNRFVTTAVWTALAILLVNAVVGEGGYLATIRAEKEQAALTSEVARLRVENQRLKEARQLLEEDPAALEVAARRQGMIREGEVVVTIREPAGTAAPAPSR